MRRFGLGPLSRADTAPDIDVVGFMRGVPYGAE
jgi:hypothetical protein